MLDVVPYKDMEYMSGSKFPIRKEEISLECGKCRHVTEPDLIADH